jgi:Calcineurin-like phosphoesterase
MIAKIISVDWESALLSYCTKSLGFIKVKLSDHKGNVHLWESIEANSIGRIELKGLLPDSSYSGEFEAAEGCVSIKVKTLPAPQGEKICSYAIVADPHISCKTENRKGRFLLESAMILRDVVGLCNSLKPDCVLIPGDITNDGIEEEYSLSAKILQDLEMPCIATPGNHDYHHGEPSIKCWEKYFASKSNVYDTPGGKIIALNTAKAHLIPEEAHSLYSLLKKDFSDPIIIISHYQLFDNEHICRGGAQKVVKNSDEQQQLLNLIRQKKLIIYAGHQNVCSVKPVGKSFQINAPQPVQHPCGFIYVSRYQNGFYHKFIPISSEILRQWSTVSGGQAVDLYNENQWDSLYREGKDLYQTNFLINF